MASVRNIGKSTIHCKPRNKVDKIKSVVMRYLLLVAILVIVCFSSCRKPVTKTEIFADSSEVSIPRDTVIIIEGTQISENVNIDSILTIREGQIIKRFDSLNRSYLSIVRNGRNLQVDCNCLDTSVNAQLNDKLKTVTRKETKTIIEKQQYIPRWIWIVVGGLIGAVFVLLILMLARR